MISKDDRILVTGATGFLGSAICKELLANGYYDIVPVYGGVNINSYYRRDRFEKETSLTTYHYNLMRRESVTTMYRQQTPNVVIHAAAMVGGIGLNQVAPGTLFYNNMQMGLNVIEKARHCTRLKKLVLLSTICCYPKVTPVPFKEEDIYQGKPENTNFYYAEAKKALAAMADAYRLQYGMNNITLIPVNLMGPGDNFDLQTSHVIPAIIRKIDMAKENNAPYVIIWGTGQASREFLYVDDCACAIRLAMEKYDKVDPVNIGTGREIKICDLVDMIVAKIGYTGNVVYDTSKPDGQPRRCLDVTRAQQEFGFTAQTDLSTGLDKTIGWYYANKHLLS